MGGWFAACQVAWGWKQRGSFSCACSGKQGTADDLVLFVGLFFFLFFSSFIFSPSLLFSSSCLMSLQTSGEKKRSGHTASNGFAGHINLPDLVQQSHSPAGTPTEALGRVSTHAQDMDSVPEVGGGGAPLSPLHCFQHVLTSLPHKGAFLLSYLAFLALLSLCFWSTWMSVVGIQGNLAGYC